MQESRREQSVKRSARNLPRRTVLTCVIGAVGALAGCTNTDETPTPTVRTETPTSTSSTGSLAQFRSNLEASGIEISALDFTAAGDTVELAYVSANPNSQEALTNEVGTITGEFYNSISNGLAADRLDATLLDADENEQITWYAEREWYTQFQNGELSANELTLRVLNTVEEV